MSTDARPRSTYCGVNAHDRCGMKRCGCDCHQPTKEPKMPSVVEWEDPPPGRRGRTARDWTPVIAELRAHPKRWGKVHIAETKAGAGYNATKLRKAAGVKEFEVRAAGVFVFARFVGARGD